MFAYRVDDQIEIRLLEERHAREVFAAVDANREHIGRWLPWVEHTRSESDVRKFIRDSLLGFARQTVISGGMWCGGVFVGGIGSHLEKENWKASIGYWIAAEHEGKGIVTRCAKAMVDYLFFQRELNRVIIRCAVENVRSRAIPQRLGFTEEGTHREDFVVQGKALDVVIYGKLSREWSKGAA